MVHVQYYFILVSSEKQNLKYFLPQGEKARHCPGVVFAMSA